MLSEQSTETFIYTFRDQIAALTTQVKLLNSLVNQLQAQVNALMNKGG